MLVGISPSKEDPNGTKKVKEGQICSLLALGHYAFGSWTFGLNLIPLAPHFSDPCIQTELYHSAFLVLQLADGRLQDFLASIIM